MTASQADRPLTERERSFVTNYTGVDKGNGTAAAIRAGYSRRTAASAAWRLLRKVEIRRAIEDLRQADPAVLDRAALQRFWTEVALGRFPEASMRDRLLASQLLAKTQGLFADSNGGNHAMSLSELIMKTVAHRQQSGSSTTQVATQGAYRS